MEEREGTMVNASGPGPTTLTDSFSGATVTVINPSNLALQDGQKVIYISITIPANNKMVNVVREIKGA